MQGLRLERHTACLGTVLRRVDTLLSEQEREGDISTLEGEGIACTCSTCEYGLPTYTRVWDGDREIGRRARLLGELDPRTTYSRYHLTIGEAHPRAREDTSPEYTTLETRLSDRLAVRVVISHDSDPSVLVQTEERLVGIELDGGFLGGIGLDGRAVLGVPGVGSVLRRSIDQGTPAQEMDVHGEEDGLRATDRIACRIDPLPDLTRSTGCRLLEVVIRTATVKKLGIWRLTA